MPSESPAQHRFFGAVRAAQKGGKPISREVGKAARSMTVKQVRDFAKAPKGGYRKARRAKRA